MLRFVFALSLYVTGSALACDGQKCDKANCPMPTAAAATGTATASAAPGAALPAGTHASLQVTGMHCESCAEHVKSALMGVQGVRGANVDVKSGLAEVSFDDKVTNADALVKAINKTGSYQAKIAPAPSGTN